MFAASPAQHPASKQPVRPRAATSYRHDVIMAFDMPPGHAGSSCRDTSSFRDKSSCHHAPQPSHAKRCCRHLVPCHDKHPASAYHLFRAGLPAMTCHRSTPLDLLSWPSRHDMPSCYDVPSLIDMSPCRGMPTFRDMSSSHHTSSCHETPDRFMSRGLLVTHHHFTECNPEMP